MTSEPKLSKGLIVTWISDKIFQNTCQESSDFYLGERTWYLKMECYNSCYISLIERERRNPETPFSVLTLAEVNQEHPYSSATEKKCYSSTVRSYKTTIWYHDDINKIESCVAGFHDHAELRVVCVFKDVAPSTCRINSETIEVTTQTDFDCILPLKTLHDDKLSSGESEQGASCVSSNLDSLSRDLSKLLDDKVLPDITLRCGDRTVAAHKAVLAARSKVFTAMFQSKMSESETGVVEIIDIDVQVLELFLKYLYSGRLFESSHEDLLNLYAAGEKYAVTALTMECCEHLINNLTQENCFSSLLMADAHGNQEFKNAIFNFILNHVGILAGDEWKIFSQENLALSNEILQLIVKRKCLS